MSVDVAATVYEYPALCSDEEYAFAPYTVFTLFQEWEVWFDVRDAFYTVVTGEAVHIVESDAVSVF